MSNISKALKYLGTKQKDLVTGYTGVVTSISFDINGCIQAALKPPMDKDGKIPDGCWFDLERLEQIGKPVMKPFPYEVTRKFVAGPADKPAK
jgi:hypothetical protein